MPAGFSLISFKLRFRLKLAVFNLTSSERYIRTCGRYISKLNKKILKPNQYAMGILKMDCSAFDLSILDKAAKLTKASNLARNVKMDPSQICFLASKIYDMGGHTELIIRMLGLFNEFKTHFIEANSSCGGKEESLAPHKMQLLKQITQAKTLDRETSICKAIEQLYNALIETKAKNIFVFIHPEDVVGTAVLGLLKKYTNSHIIFIPHADHLLNLGLEFSDVILGGRAITQARLARYKDKFVPCPNIPKSSAGQAYTKDAITNARSQFGIAENEYVSLTGCSSYKVFKDPQLPYWRLIKKLLQAEPKLKHLFVSDMEEKEFAELNKLFADATDDMKRIIFLNSVPDLSLYINMADIFIDSFPIGSSLVHLDVIKEKKLTIIKINMNNTNLSFESCLYEGYEYAFADTDTMTKKILHILADKDERAAIIDKVSRYYAETYSQAKLKKKYLSVVDSS